MKFFCLESGSKDDVSRREDEDNRGLRVVVTTLGASLVSVESKDRYNHWENILLTYGDRSFYQSNPSYLGATVGRVANRISGGKFTLDLNGGLHEYILDQNDGPNCLHGGFQGISFKDWEVVDTDAVGDQAIGTYLTLRTVSEHGESGFPGRVIFHVTYRVCDMLNNKQRSSQLTIEFMGEVDRPTILSLTNHAYFNLSGLGRGTIFDHQLCLNSDFVAETDDVLCATGVLHPVRGTSYDFVELRPVRAHGGVVYDHYFVVRGQSGTLRPAALVFEPQSGRSLSISTTHPGLQFYTGHFLDGGITGPEGQTYQKSSGFCLETHDFPNAVNCPSFPSTLIGPQQQYKHKTIYEFSIGEIHNKE